MPSHFAPPATAHVQAMRDAEGVALAAWLTASTAHDRAVAQRATALARAQARVVRAMTPLSPLRYERMEAAYAARNFRNAADYVRVIGNLRRSVPAVAAARENLAAVRVVTDMKVHAARVARAQAARALLALPPLPDDVVRATRQQLGLLARE
jgi:hypothetical protein